MKVLFIGGTGVISSACSALAVERGIDLYILNRGKSDLRPASPDAHLLHADIRQPKSVAAVLGDMTFDAVVDWVAFTPEHIETDLNLFRGQVGQYVFISSASAYQTPPSHLPITESTPLHNPVWRYSQNKIACELRLRQAYRDENFPITIVRPSHTYDRTLIPLHGGYTVLHRMRQGKPTIVHGDGASLWVLTHNTDFAKGLVGLLGNSAAIGHAFQITSDELLTWNQIAASLAHALGVEANIVHIPSEFIAKFDSNWGDGLLGDKTHSVVFDNRKIKRLVPDFVCPVPFARGAQEITDWYLADPARQQVDAAFDALVDRIISTHQMGLTTGA